MKKKPKKDTISKVVDDLDSIIDRIDVMPDSCAPKDPFQRCFFSNISHDLRKISEQLDEYNLNNPK